jgi:hypothetical protein
MINNPTQAPTPDFGFHEGEVIREISQQDYLDLKQAKIPRPAAFRSHIVDGVPSPFCSVRSSRFVPISTVA